MTDYYTRDGVKIEVGKIYLINENIKFRVMGFKSPGNDFPIVGVDILSPGSEDSAVYHPYDLSSIPNSQKQYDPKEMWVVWIGEDEESLYSSGQYFNSLKEAKRIWRDYNLFAIAKFGQPFVKGENL